MATVPSSSLTPVTAHFAEASEAGLTELAAAQGAPVCQELSVEVWLVVPVPKSKTMYSPAALPLIAHLLGLTVSPGMVSEIFVQTFAVGML